MTSTSSLAHRLQQNSGIKHSPDNLTEGPNPQVCAMQVMHNWGGSTMFFAACLGHCISLLGSWAQPLSFQIWREVSLLLLTEALGQAFLTR